MMRFVLRRLVGAAVLVLAVGSTAFVLIDLAPGDYVSGRHSIGGDPSDILRERHRLGLDRPLAARYSEWLIDVLTLDGGESLLYDGPVGPLVRSRAVNTAILALTAFAVAATIGVGLSLAAARAPDGVVSRLTRHASLISLSLPPFVTSLVLVWLAARTGWFPPGGMPVREVGSGMMGWLADLAWYLPLPVLALALPVAAMLERIQTQALGEALASPAIHAARARGVPESAVLIRHAWRLSLKPVAAVAGLVFGGLLSGSFAVEVVTSWPGLGRLTVEALRAQDLNLVAGCAIAAAIVLSIGVVLADITAAWSDPRVQLDPTRGVG